MEKVEVMAPFGNIYKDRKVLVTGHTGFKGSWLALWLHQIGAQVTGLSLPPDTKPSHWDLLQLDIPEHHIDIRDADALSQVIQKIKPDIVFHLAAQSLVRRSYHIPLDTWAVNVQGTVNLLDTCRNVSSIEAIVAVTTDKCYENKETGQAYKETDRLGGHDPYSASKAAMEIAVGSYRDSFFTKDGPLVATTRAGNVIGGGDWALDRLIPDLARAQEKNEQLIIRSPNSTRPWQHVLEPLSGYLQLGQRLLEKKRDFAAAWNFGPDETSALSVEVLLDRMRPHWPGMNWQVDKASTLHEAKMLQLDSTKARTELKWQPVLTLQQQLEMTADWYQAFHENKAVLSSQQLQAYMMQASTSATWA